MERPLARLSVLASLLFVLAISADTATATYPPAANGRIVFIRSIGESPADIYLMNNDGSGQVDVTPGTPEGELHPVFSPNGKKIAFERIAFGPPIAIDLWTMNPDGQNQVNITAGKLKTPENPAYSPDGKRIALTAIDPNVGDNQAVFLINADGSNPVQVTPSEPSNTSYYMPDFAPDGKRLVAYRCVNISCGISLINVDGTGVQHLTAGKNPGGDFSPEFSPDGTKIVFERDVSSGDEDIFVMNADGSGQTNLTESDPQVEGEPTYSPDGNRIVFFRDIFPPSIFGGVNDDLFQINSDGCCAVDLTAGATGNDFNPSWEYRFQCKKRKATIVGSNAGETIRGTRKADVIVALGGNDVVKALAGKDYVCGGDGNDTIKAGSGNDVVVGGLGADKLIGGKGKDRLKGGRGRDAVRQ